VLVALAIGPAVAVGYRAVDTAALSCRTTLGAASLSGRADPVAEYCDGKQ
jgi:hypothetical protein